MRVPFEVHTQHPVNVLIRVLQNRFADIYTRCADNDVERAFLNIEGLKSGSNGFPV